MPNSYDDTLTQLAQLRTDVLAQLSAGGWQFSSTIPRRDPWSLGAAILGDRWIRAINLGQPSASGEQLKSCLWLATNGKFYVSDDWGKHRVVKLNRKPLWFLRATQQSLAEMHLFLSR